MADEEKEIAKMSLEEQAAEIRARAAGVAGRAVPGPSREPGAPSYPKVEVKVLTRIVGDERGPDPNLMHGDVLSAQLSKLRSEGWTIHTTRVIGLQVGGLMLYFLLERQAPA